MKINFVSFIFLTIYTLSKCTATEDLVDNLFGDLYKKKIYSGYLGTADKNRNLHYVFVESQNNPEKDPLVLWLNGGPGCSSLLGFIQEHGPVVIPDYTRDLVLNQFAWNKKANVIYLESPAGVGFSYNDNGPTDMKYTDSLVANDNRLALVNFFLKFPEYKKNDFYISGESYAGVYVPTLAENILKNPSSQINLKGIIVGNGLTDLDTDIEPALVDFAYDHLLYSVNTRDNYIKNCNSTVLSSDCIKVRKEIKQSMQGLNIYDIYRECPSTKKGFLQSSMQSNVNSHQSTMINTLKRINKLQKLKKLTENAKYENIFSAFESFNKNIVNLSDDVDEGIWPDSCADDPFPSDFFNNNQTKIKLHVRTNITYLQCNNDINSNYTFGESLKVYNNTLLNSGIRIWFYSGDTDAAVPFTGSIKWIPKLKMQITENYRKWIVNGQIAGYVQSYDSLVYVTILGTGHMAPQWKREQSFIMFNSFLKGERLPLS